MDSASSLRDLVKLHVFVDPVFDQNCYVLRRRDTRRCLLVNPGLQADGALRFLEQRSIGCDRILLSHGHPDHVAGVPAAREAHRCPAAIHPADRFLLTGPPIFPGLLPDLPPIECDEDLGGGEVLFWQGLQIQVLHTPGHSPGSVCFLVGPDLLSGDTLFRRSVGRTDLPGGSMETLVFSVQDRLYRLPPETVVHPGHGPATTIGEEMRANPFVTAAAGR